MAEARKTVTVVFADVSGSTELGERLDAEVVRRVMERYFATARDVLVRHGGTVEKFIGDAVVAVFGIPVAHEDDAFRAMLAATEMRDALTALNDELRRERDVVLAVRTGVNTGEVVAGDASEGQFYVTGDAVNVAARLEQAAGPGEILLGEDTYSLVRHAVSVEAAAPLTVKGKSAPLRAYRLVELIEGAPALARRFDTPFVGRERELTRLESAFRRVVEERHPTLLTVVANAGMGKTRLAAEFSTRLQEEANVLDGRCLSYGEGITFWPLAEIRRKLPALPAEVDDPEEATTVEDAFVAYRKLFEALGRRRPLVLVFEDIHWAEPTLLDFLEHVATWTREAQILILCLARPEFAAERSGWPGEVLELTPLSPAEADRLANALAGDADAQTRARATQTAEGNPLFLEHVLALVSEDGGDAAVPRTIQALLAARLDGLEAAERQVLEAAAVIGKEFWRSALVELCPPEAEISSLLQRLMRSRLIAPTATSLPNQDAFEFAHILIRDAAYAGIAKETRAELHERLADWLQANESAYEEIVGYHLEAATRYERTLRPTSDRGRELSRRAGRTLASAGKRAHARQDHGAAANLITRALDLLPEDEPDWAALVPLVDDDLFWTGRYDDARSLLRRARETARRTGNRQLECHVRLSELIVAAHTGGDLLPVRDFVAQAESVLAALEELGDVRGQAKARLHIGVARSGQFQNELATQVLERAVEDARRIGDTALEGSCLGLLGRTLIDGPTPIAEAIERMKELLAALPTRITEGVLARQLSTLAAKQASFSEAEKFLARARAVADEFGTEVDSAHYLAYAAVVDRCKGRLTDAEAKLRECAAILERLGEKSWRSTIVASLAGVLTSQERFEEAEAFLAEADETAAADDLATQVPLRQIRAAIAAEQKQFGLAEALAREAVSLVEGTDDLDAQGSALLNLARILHAAARNEESARLAKDAARLLEAKGNVVRHREATRLLSLVTATTALDDVGT